MMMRIRNSVQPGLVGLLMVMVACICVVQGRASEAQEAGSAAVELGSPRQTMFSFLAAANDALLGKPGGLDRVAETLDMSAIESPDEARLLVMAERIKGVIDRLGEVRPLHLPDTAIVGAEQISRYTFFPRGDEHGWIWEKLGDAPRGSIVLTKVDTGIWKFDAATVAGIDELFDSMRSLPPRYAAEPVQSELVLLLGSTFNHTEWWQWLMLLLLIFIGLAAGKFIQATFKRMENSAEQRQWELRRLLAQDAAGPISLVCLAVGLLFGMQFIYLEPDMQTFSRRVLLFLFLVGAGWFAYNIVNIIEIPIKRAAAGNPNIEKMILPLVRKSLRIFLVIVLSIVILQNVFELNITGFLAGLGIVGLALSLAAQDSVKNLFGSLTVFMDRPFQVGNFITFDGVTGVVEEIGFRSTRIRQVNGHLVTIPNMRFIDNRVENIAARQFIHHELVVTVTYDTPPEKVEETKAILLDILTAPEVVEEGRFDMEAFPPRVFFLDYNADGLGIRAVFRYQLVNDPDRHFWTFRAFLEKINLQVLRRINEAGIDFAFPTKTLHLAGDPKRELAIRVRRDD